MQNDGTKKKTPIDNLHFKTILSIITHIECGIKLHVNINTTIKPTLDKYHVNAYKRPTWDKYL